jgi:hypothetical protein
MEEPEDHLWSADHSLRNGAVDRKLLLNVCRCTQNTRYHIEIITISNIQ